MTQIGIVVVTYNRLALLQEVVGALRQQTVTDYDIVIVNNGSTDGTLDWLNEQKDIQTITQENLGGAGGFFTGMKYVAEQGYKYCWLMDDDVICKPTALEELLKAIMVKEGIGFVCSRVLGTDGRPMNTPIAAKKPMKKGVYSDLFELVNDYAMVRLERATFVSVLVPTSIIFEVGLPYKEYFIWGDDSEYTERISCKYPSYVACRSEVIHKRSLQAPLSFYTETDKKRLNNYFYMFRNTIYTAVKGKGLTTWVRYYIVAIITMLRLLFAGEFIRLSLYAKAYWALLTFRPKVQYPQKSH